MHSPGKWKFLRKNSNSRKIARIAPISTIIGPNESSRRDPFLENFSKERNEQKDFEKFENFSKYFHTFRSFENFSKNRLRRDDSFGPKIIEIGAILAIFRLCVFFSEKFSLKVRYLFG